MSFTQPICVCVTFTFTLSNILTQCHFLSMTCGYWQHCLCSYYPVLLCWYFTHGVKYAINPLKLTKFSSCSEFDLKVRNGLVWSDFRWSNVTGSVVSVTKWNIPCNGDGQRSKPNTKIFTALMWKARSGFRLCFQTPAALSVPVIHRSASISVTGEQTNSLGSDWPAMTSNLVSNTVRHLRERGN